MIAANYTEFRTALKDYLDRVENDKETLIIKRKSGKGFQRKLLMKNIVKYSTIF